MHQPDRPIVQSNRSANHAGRMNFTLAVPQRQGTVILNVTSKDRFPFLQYGLRQKLGDSLILWPPVGVPGNHFEFFRIGRPRILTRNHQDPARVNVCSFNQGIESHAADTPQRRFIGQLEGETAKSRGRPPDFRNGVARLSLFTLKKFGLLPTMSNRRGLGG